MSVAGEVAEYMIVEGHLEKGLSEVKCQMTWTWDLPIVSILPQLQRSSKDMPGSSVELILNRAMNSHPSNNG